MEKKSFLFYTSWNDAIKKMDEHQLRRFIDNLCNYAEGNPIILDDLVDEIMWSQVKPLLDYNENKRQKRIENGKKGGAPIGNSNATKNNLNQANQPKTSVDGRGKKEEGRTLKVEGREKKEEGREKMEDVEGRKLKVETIKGIITDENNIIVNFDIEEKFDINKLSDEELIQYIDNIKKNK